jgi:hypothetical protein
MSGYTAVPDEQTYLQERSNEAWRAIGQGNDVYSPLQLNAATMEDGYVPIPEEETGSWRRQGLAVAGGDVYTPAPFPSSSGSTASLGEEYAPMPAPTDDRVARDASAARRLLLQQVAQAQAMSLQAGAAHVALPPSTGVPGQQQAGYQSTTQPLSFTSQMQHHPQFAAAFAQQQAMAQQHAMAMAAAQGGGRTNRPHGGSSGRGGGSRGGRGGSRGGGGGGRRRGGGPTPCFVCNIMFPSQTHVAVHAHLKHGAPPPAVLG